jgi:integrase/recombinase XerD
MTDSLLSHDDWLLRLRNHLRQERYGSGYAGRCMAAARKFLTFLRKRNIAISDTQPETVEAYVKAARREYRRRTGNLPAYERWSGSQQYGINMLLRMVCGKWPPARVAVTPAELYAQKLCDEYATSLREMRGLAMETVSDRQAEAGRFLSWLGERVNREALVVGVADVDAYMKSRAESQLQRPSIKSVATHLRSFLRWLHTTRRSAQDLSVLVRAPQLYAFESIPSALRSSDIQKILSVARRDRSATGLRDYAILILLAEYGLRAGEIARLRLDDVDWRSEVIRIRHQKTGLTSWLPLLPNVGEAFLRYLQQSRPKTSFREVFIRSIAPYRPFKSGSSLYTRARYQIDAAGIAAGGKRGPHAFRHARAVSMIRAAVPLKEIGDLLGHRSADSTLVYLKLATEDLRGVALGIPGEVNR